MSVQTATSKALTETLAWESTRTDPGQKPLRMIEWAAKQIDELHDDRMAYFEAFEGITADTMADVMAKLEEMPDAVAAARRTALAHAQISAYADTMKARGRGALLAEWVAILADRYAGAAILLQTATA